MTLNEWGAATKRRLHDELVRGEEPPLGRYDKALLKEAKSLGHPQIGTTVYHPQSATFEFIYSGTNSVMIVPVEVPSPERIVFLPVPTWVVESIWQGEIDGSFHFESAAIALVDELRSCLSAEANARLFEKKLPTRRE